MRKNIVCLANSYKDGGRCVAGICVETGEWLRMRGKADDGTLTPREYALGEGAGEPRLLDVLQVELHYAMPSDCHPENWVIAPVRWQLLNRPCSDRLWAQVARSEHQGAPLLSGYRDRIAAEELRRRPVAASLALVAAEDIWWWVREEAGGKRKNRALFRRNHVTYNLAVTDPRWLDQMNLLPAGIYPHTLLAPDAKNTWLTVSLSEAFEANAGAGAWHYRIVAGVVVR
jgi:hypothetical protein